MLSQRIAKAYFMIASDIQVDKYRNELDDSMAMYNEAHENLKDYYRSNVKVTAALRNAEAIWYNFREIVSGDTFSINKCNAVFNASSNLLEANQEVVKEASKGSGSNRITKIIDKSGSLRMLSQKLALHYLAIYLELPRQQIITSFEEAIETVNKRLGELKEEKRVNTGEIASRLETASRHWDFARRNLAISRNLKPAAVGSTLNTFLREMNTVTGLYADIGREGEN